MTCVKRKLPLEKVQTKFWQNPGKIQTKPDTRQTKIRQNPDKFRQNQTKSDKWFWAQDLDCQCRRLSIGDVKIPRYQVDMKRILKKEGAVVGLANGALYSDDKLIYEAENLKVGLFK